MQIVITRTRLLVVAIALVGVGLWFLFDWLIVSDAECVETTLGRIADNVNRGDAAAVEPDIDETFKLGHIDGGSFRGWLERALNRFGPVKISTYSTEVEVEGDTAKVLVETWVEGRMLAGRLRLDWKVEMVRRGEAWKVSRIRGFMQPGNNELSLATIETLVP